jgi:alanyl-tRNA synthetase
MALFGEKYSETVRTITIGGEKPFSYELCGGTHVGETGVIGICLITSEGSVAAGIRRIEAVTGRKAYELIQNRFQIVSQAASLLESPAEALPEKITNLQDELSDIRKQLTSLRQNLVADEFDQKLQQVTLVNGVRVLATRLNDADADTLRQMVDRFRQLYSTQGVIVVGSVRWASTIISLTEDLLARVRAVVDRSLPHHWGAVVVVPPGTGRRKILQAGRH